jgi:hypothetical protein
MARELHRESTIAVRQWRQDGDRAEPRVAAADAEFKLYGDRQIDKARRAERAGRESLVTGAEPPATARLWVIQSWHGRVRGPGGVVDDAGRVAGAASQGLIAVILVDSSSWVHYPRPNGGSGV